MTQLLCHPDSAMPVPVVEAADAPPAPVPGVTLPPMLTLAEAARAMGFDKVFTHPEREVMALCKAGRLRQRIIKKRRLIDPASVTEWLSAMATPAKRR